MGRILDSLKRREPNGTAHHAEPEREEPAILPAPASSAEDEWSLGSDVPFIEVPAQGTSSGQQAAPVVTASAVPASADAHFEPSMLAHEAPLAQPYRQACAGLWSHLCAAELKSLLLLPLGAVPLPSILEVVHGLRGADCRRLLLIDTDVNANRLATELNHAAAIGWSSLLNGLPAAQVVQATRWPGLDLIPAGTRLANLTPALALRKARAQLAVLVRRYDLVLLLASGWDSAGLPSLMVYATGGTCLLAAQGPEAARQTEHAASQLMQQSVNVVGSMLLV